MAANDQAAIAATGRLTMADSVTLFSPLEPIVLATKLKEEMEKREDRDDFHVFGGGTEDEITLIYGHNEDHTGIEPRLQGKMRFYDGGTLIEAEVTSVGNLGGLKVFLIIWCLALTPFLAISTVLWFISEVPLIGKFFCTVVIFAMLGIGLLKMRGLNKHRQEDHGTVDHILDFLEETVDAKPVNQD